MQKESEKLQQKTEKRAGGVLQNFGFLTLGKTLGDLFTFMLFVVLSRKFGQEGIGNYSFAIGVTGFFMVLADYGLSSLSIKEMSRNIAGAREYYSRVFTIRLVLVILTYLLLLLISYFLPVSNEAWQVITVVGAYQILYSVLEGFGAVFIAHERMHFTGLMEFSAKATSAVFCVALVLAGGGLVMSLTMLPVVIGVHILVAYVILSKEYGRPRLAITWRELKGKLREATPYALFLLLYQLTTRVDVVVLGLMLGAAAAGVYNVAYRVIFMLLFVSYFGGLSLFPLVSRLYSKSEEELYKLYHDSLRVAILVALPAATGIWLIAPGLVTLIYGAEFVDAIPILRVLAAILFFASITSIMGTFLTACDRQAERTRSQWTSAWVNVVGNVSLIPIFGIKGAAYSTLFAEGLLAILIAYRLKVLFGWPQIGSRLMIGLVGVLAFCIPLEYFAPLPIMVLIVLAVLIYTVVLMLFREVRTNEGKMLVSMLKGWGFC